MIANRVLQVKDRSYFRVLHKLALSGYRRLAGRSLVSYLWFLCESAHGNFFVGLDIMTSNGWSPHRGEAVHGERPGVTPGGPGVKTQRDG